MKTTSFASYFMFFICCLFAARVSASEPAQAHIQAGEHGQALLLERLGECYAVTPAHVIGEDLFATLVGASPKTPKGDADLLQKFGYDLSILRATGAVANHCGGALDTATDLDSVLSDNTVGVVSSVNADGSITRRNITFSDVGLVYLRLRPRESEDQLFKGLSGSLVLVRNKPIGILMSVHPETGEGRALRYDRAIETLRPFFGLSEKKLTDDGEILQSNAPSSDLRARVVSWSSPSLGSEYRASHLVDDGGATTVWFAHAREFPIELVIALSGEEMHIVDRLRLIGEGVEPKERLPRDFEILVSNGRGWISVSSGTYFKNEQEKSVRFAPVRARQIMLRLYSHWGDTEAVGLSGIKIPAQ